MTFQEKIRELYLEAEKERAARAEKYRNFKMKRPDPPRFAALKLLNALLVEED